MPVQFGRQDRPDDVVRRRPVFFDREHDENYNQIYEVSALPRKRQNQVAEIKGTNHLHILPWHWRAFFANGSAGNKVTCVWSNFMESSAVTAAVSGIVGAILGAGGITPILIALTNHKRQTFLDTQQAMSEMFVQLRDRIEAVESAERECIKAREELLIEMGGLRAEVELLRSKFRELQ